MRDHLQSVDCARYLKALADAERLKIVQCLQGGPKNVSDLASLLADELANVSHHLRVLKQVGLVQDRRDGKFVVYSLNPAFFRTGERLDLGCCQLDLGG